MVGRAPPPPCPWQLGSRGPAAARWASWVVSAGAGEALGAATASVMALPPTSTPSETAKCGAQDSEASEAAALQGDEPMSSLVALGTQVTSPRQNAEGNGLHSKGMEVSKTEGQVGWGLSESS